MERLKRLGTGNSERLVGKIYKQLKTGLLDEQTNGEVHDFSPSMKGQDDQKSGGCLASEIITSLRQFQKNALKEEKPCKRANFKIRDQGFSLYEELMQIVHDKNWRQTENLDDDSKPKPIFKCEKIPASYREHLHRQSGRGRALTEFNTYMKECNQKISKLETEIEQFGGNNPKRTKTVQEKAEIRALRNQRQAQITRMKQRMKEEGHRIRLRILLDFLPEDVDRKELERLYFSPGIDANDRFVEYLESRLEESQ